MESPIMTTLIHEDLEVGERAIANLAGARGKTMPVEALHSNAFLRTNKANQCLHARVGVRLSHTSQGATVQTDAGI